MSKTDNQAESLRSFFFRSMAFIFAAAPLLLLPGCSSPPKTTGVPENPRFDPDGRYYEVLGDCRPVISEYAENGSLRHFLRMDHRGTGDTVKICLFSDNRVYLRAISKWAACEKDGVILSGNTHHCIEITGFKENPDLHVRINGKPTFCHLRHLGNKLVEELPSHVFFSDPKAPVLEGPESVLVVQYRGIVTLLHVYGEDLGGSVNNCNVVITPPGGGSGEGGGLALTRDARQRENRNCPTSKLIRLDYKSDGDHLVARLISDVSLHFGSNRTKIHPGTPYLLTFTIRKGINRVLGPIKGTIREWGCDTEEDLGSFTRLGDFDSRYGSAPALSVLPETTTRDNNATVEPFGTKRARLVLEYRGGAFGCSFEKCGKDQDGQAAPRSKTTRPRRNKPGQATT